MFSTHGGVGVMRLENMGPLVFMDIFVQEIRGRNPGTLFQQLLPALGSFVSHILLKGKENQ